MSMDVEAQTLSVVAEYYRQLEALGPIKGVPSFSLIGLGGLTQKRDYVRDAEGRFAEATTPRIFNTPEDIKPINDWGKTRYEFVKEPGHLLTGEPIARPDLPDVLYHVTTAGAAVESSGVLLGQQSGGGLGGGQADGVSFTTSLEDAQVIQRELIRAIEIASSTKTTFTNTIERYAREDELSAGLPPGTLDKAVGFARDGWTVNMIGVDHTFVEVRDPVTNAYISGDYSGPPPEPVEHERLRRSVLKDALNVYLQLRGHQDIPSLKNPLLMGDQKALVTLNPLDVKILEVPSTQIPPTALVTTGSDKFLHEVRVYSDVPMRRKTLASILKFDEGAHPRDPAGKFTDKMVTVREQAFRRWFNQSKVVDDDGLALTVYHGSTHDITEFAPAGDTRLNAESAWGAGIYFSDAQRDVEANYANEEGPDLKSRIENRAEQIEGESEQDDEDLQHPYSMTHEEGLRKARAELAPSGPRTIPVYLSLQHPFIVGEGGSHKETQLTYDSNYDPDDEDANEEPTGTLIDFTQALRDEASDFGSTDGVEDFIQQVLEYGMEHDGMSASALDALWRKTEAMGYIESNETGQLVGAELFRRALEKTGFDGIIDHTVNDKFGTGSNRGHGMVGMNPDTTHYIAFTPTQIKSAVGNSGTFDPKNALITKRGFAHILKHQD